ncbi:MAG: BrnT family toxin [Xanthomonadaceae bacterium]|nr:BrnT family toxin [Xanthomonadaceae bacterium]
MDFVKAQELWNSPHFEFLLRSDGESRWGVIGIIEGVFWTAVITRRSKNIRIISIRRSRNEEKQAYQNRFKADYK